MHIILKSGKIEVVMFIISKVKLCIDIKLKNSCILHWALLNAVLIYFSCRSVFMAQKMPKIFIEYLRLVNRIHSHASFLLTFDIKIPMMPIPIFFMMTWICQFLSHKHVLKEKCLNSKLDLSKVYPIENVNSVESLIFLIIYRSFL